MRLLITDLEATCCDDGSIPLDEVEIIEIGATVMAFDGKSWESLGCFSSFVKPEIHAELTEFCTSLTTITQDMVKNAPTLPTAYKQYEKWARSYQVSKFASWGGYDYRQFKRSLKRHDMSFMFQRNECLNLIELYAKARSLKKRRGISLLGALNSEGLSFEGTYHRGIDDAINISKLLGVCLGDSF